MRTALFSERKLTSLGLSRGVLATMNALLFGSGQQGVWYDPSDFSTLFQDAAGTTPVTAMEQPVGLILDKSQGLVLGPELVTGGGFDDPANWTSSAWTVSAGVATYPDTINDFIRPANANLLPLVAGKFYRVRFTLSGVTGSAVCAVTNADGSVAYTAITTFTTDGEKQFIIYAAASTTNVRFYGYTTSGGTWSLDDFSIKELTGNHASQATTTKRGVVSRRVNLLTKTEQFDNAAWAKDYGSITPNAYTSPSGRVFQKYTPDATNVGAHRVRQLITIPNNAHVLSFEVKAAGYAGIKLRATSAWVNFNLTTGTVGNSNNVSSPTIAALGDGVYRVSGTFSVGASYVYIYVDPFDTISPDSGLFTGDGTSGIYISAADVRLAIDAHLPYQSVNTATDYDADPNKFPTYIRFDGVDDAYQTNSINFTGTDKMTVWAGVTKLSDAAAALLLESSANWNLNNGSLLVAAPNSPGTFEFGSQGTIEVVISRSGFPAPINATLSMSANIGGPSLVSRINGVSSSVSTSSQGTGNYGNYPLYIGARNNTSLFFSGRIYSLIVRGAESSLSQIEATELYMKQKMRLP